MQGKLGLPIVIQQLPDGRQRFNVSFESYTTEGTLDGDPASMRASAMLIPRATASRLKIKACRYFLLRIREYIRNQAAALYYTEAFIQSLRSATFVLQKAISHSIEAKVWYETKRAEMASQPLLKLLVELRNATEKEGISLARYGPIVVIRQYLDGRLEAESGEPSLEVLGHTIPKPLDAFDSGLETISAIVEEAHERGFVLVPDQFQHTLEMHCQRERPDGTWEYFDLPG